MTRRQHNNPNNIIKVNSVLTPFVLPIFFGEFCEKIIRFEFKPSAQTFPFQGSIVRYGGPLPTFKKKKKNEKKEKKKKNLQMNNFFKENIDIYILFFVCNKNHNNNNKSPSHTRHKVFVSEEGS